MHNEFPCDGVEHAQYRHLLRLPRRGDAQVRSAWCPGVGEVWMGQGFGFVSVKQDDIAGLSLLAPDPKAKTDAVDLSRVLAPLQSVPGAPPAGPSSGSGG